MATDGVWCMKIIHAVPNDHAGVGPFYSRQMSVFIPPGVWVRCQVYCEFNNSHCLKIPIEKLNKIYAIIIYCKVKRQSLTGQKAGDCHVNITGKIRGL